jgi:hypothetical protein
VKDGGNFSIVTFPLPVVRGSQGIGFCILAQVLGNRTFQSWINGKNKMLLVVVSS